MALITLSFSSCKKYGCTHPSALNYSSEANEDDGSCFFEQTNQIIYVEEFSLTFDVNWYESYYPSFNYESGDIIIMEVANEWGEWTSFPYYVGVTDAYLEGSYSGNLCFVYAYNEDGTTYYFPTPTTYDFRVALIKMNGLVLNPDLANMSISELLDTL